jgi:hypothetical protein
MSPTGISRMPVKDEADRTIGWVMWDSFGEVVEVDGVLLPTEFFLRYPGSTDQPALQLTYGIRSGVPACTAINIESKRQGRQVLPKDLEIIKSELTNWSEVAITSVMHHADASDDSVIKAPAFVDDSTARKAYRAGQKRARRKVNEQLLDEVAALYRDNFEGGVYRAIAERFDVSETTAARYVGRARKAGLLPATENGQKRI